MWTNAKVILNREIGGISSLVTGKAVYIDS